MHAEEARARAVRPRRRPGAEEVVARYGTVLVLVAVALGFTLLAPRFLTLGNLLNLCREVSPLALVAFGLTIGVAAGEFDLSVGEIASLAGILVSGLIVRQGQGVVVAVVVALAAGAAFGVVNGLLVALARIPSLIATLGTAAIALGANFAYAKGDSIYGAFPTGFTVIGQGLLGDVPVSVMITGAAAVVLSAFLTATRWGRYITATGGNLLAARLSGVNVGAYRLLALTLCGLCAAVAGIVLTSYLGTGQPQGGEPFTLDGLAAVFLGMTTLRPGQATIGGTVVGVLILGVLSNGLNLVGVPFYVWNLVHGAVLIISVSLAVAREEIRFFG